jgi:CheY-like chemotaxis protein
MIPTFKTTVLGTERGHLLVIEDSQEDFTTLLRMIQQLNYQLKIQHFLNGDEALDFLLKNGKEEENTDRSLPNLILLDLNLPGTDGRDILKAIKTDEYLRMIPVVIFTTSGSDRDVIGCSQNYANSYVIKPMDLNQMKSKLNIILKHWFEVHTMPNMNY